MFYQTNKIMATHSLGDFIQVQPLKELPNTSRRRVSLESHLNIKTHHNTSNLRGLFHPFLVFTVPLLWSSDNIAAQIPN